MKIVKGTLGALKEARGVLKSGGVVAHATDTCYGFACDTFNEAALRRLYRLKKMPRPKPISILVHDLKAARRFGNFNKPALTLAKRHWPGALTLVVKKTSRVPSFLNPGVSTIGIRVPTDTFSRNLARSFGRPITTTSANISTKPSPYSVTAIKRQFKKTQKKPDLIIDAGRLSKKNLPSTIIDASGKKIKILRQGSLRLT